MIRSFTVEAPLLNVEHTIAAYRIAKGEHWREPITDDEIVDLLTDLLHYATMLDLDHDRLIATVQMHVAAEQNEEEGGMTNLYPTLPGFGLRVVRAERLIRRLGADRLADIQTRAFDDCFEEGDGTAVQLATPEQSHLILIVRRS